MVKHATPERKYAVEEEPYPVDVFGEPNPILDTKIADYLTNDVFHYIGVYKRIKQFGLPYPSWLDAPHWVTDLYDSFEQVEREWEHWQMPKSSG